MVNQWCNKHGIRHKLIPIGEKEINGKVENTHKQNDREYFSQIQAMDYESLQATSLGYEYNWNFRRATKTLGSNADQRFIATMNFNKKRHLAPFVKKKF